MPLPQVRPNNRPYQLTASAFKYGTAQAGKSEYAQRKALGWQKRALSYLDLVPELGFASRFYAKMLVRCRIYPAFRDDQDRITPITSGEPVELLNRIRDAGGGKRQILWNYGRLAFTTGEGVLFGKALNTDDEEWMFIWNDELEVELAGGKVRKITHQPGDATTKVEYGPEEAEAYRMWTPHPRRSGEADSPMRSAVEGEIAEELIILTKSVRATAVTRLTSGMLLMPQEISPPPAEPIGDEDPLNNPFIADLAEHFETQVEMSGSASARSPLLLEAAAEYLKEIRWLKLHDPASDYLERDLRKEAVERLGQGLDLPPEALKGLGATNHWAAMQILNDMFPSHGAPIAQQFCDDIASAYYRPALRDAEFERWRDVVVCYEPPEFIKPDRAEDADKAYDRGMVGGKGYRLLKNIPEDYEQTEDEHDEWLAIKLRDPAIAGLESSQPDPSEGPPPPGPEGDSGRRTRVVASAAEMELGAAEMALARCRELAGMRVRQKEKACPECVARANGHPLSLVAAMVGPDVLTQLGLEPLKLVKDGASTFSTVLSGWGYSEAQALALAEVVEVYAARTLLEPRQPSLPPGFASQFERAKEASDVV